MQFDEDVKYDILNSYFEGMKKGMQHNLEALTEINSKINTLT